MKLQLSVLAAVSILGRVQGQDDLNVGKDPSTAAVKGSPQKKFFIPLPETSVFYDALREINSGTEWNSNNLRVRGDMVSLISIAIGFDETVVWYDHWEDGTLKITRNTLLASIVFSRGRYSGYESDLSAPNATSTEIWGDGIASNGCRPDVPNCQDADDLLNAGDSFVIESQVPVPRDASNWETAGGIKFDGGDSVSSSFPITITRGAYAQYPGSLLAGACEVFDTSMMWGTMFEAPVGQDFNVETQAFDYTRFFVMSGSDNNELTLPNGTTMVLNAGESSSFAVNQGDQLLSKSPIQVTLLTGDPGSTYELRWFTLFPLKDWATAYQAAVGDSFARKFTAV